MTLDAIIIMVGAIVCIWGVAIYSFIASSRSHEKRLRLISEQGGFESYSPSALSDLRYWIENNRGSQNVKEAIDAHNETVRQLKSQKENFYAWENSEIEKLKEI